MTRESTLEAYLVKRVKALGGQCVKVKWIGRRSAPDRRIMLPGLIPTVNGKLQPKCFPILPFWVELKATGKKATAAQHREHERMRAFGERVEIVDSFARVDEVLGL